MNPDFLDILRELSDRSVEYLVVGAYAVSVHAEPRSTGDIDIFVRADPDNAERVRQALSAFGAPLGDLSVDDLATEGTVFQIGVPPYRIDILTQIDGLTFDQACRNRLVIDVDGLPVPFIGRAELIINKRASGRDKDLLDLHLLERHDPGVR